MASTFKNLLNDDVTTTRTLLHEAIPITGTIVTGTYNEENIKTFTHGMFESVYDYPYLSSSANHIFDVTFGYSSYASSSANTQNAKKLNVYNQMAQVLMGYTTASLIRKFDSDGTLSTSPTDTGLMHHAFFVNFSRLLAKDEVKKGSFRIKLFASGAITNAWGNDGSKVDGNSLQTIGDYKAANEFRTSPAGDYGLVYTASADINSKSSIGLVFYQAGVLVLSSSVFPMSFGGPQPDLIKASHAVVGEAASNPLAGAHTPNGVSDLYSGINQAITGSTIEQMARGFRMRVNDLDFNNTIELNSTIYFCRVNHNEFNYSSNPTYVTGSKLRVKKNYNDLPLSYITSIGLYSSDNELLAVAKLSEPIRKDPNTELTLRVRLDY